MVKQILAIVCMCVAMNAQAEDLPDRIANWLRNHKFEEVASSGDMAAGRLGDVYVIATHDFVVVRENTFGSTHTWTAKMFDALHFAFTRNDGLAMRTIKQGNRHVATIWRAERDKQVRDFASLQEPGIENDREQFRLAMKAINEHLQRQQ